MYLKNDVLNWYNMHQNDYLNTHHVYVLHVLSKLK